MQWVVLMVILHLPVLNGELHSPAYSELTLSERMVL